jgi:predicted dehydrogenase
MELRENRLRIAVVGLGKMGLLHAGILNVLPNVQLTALVEKSFMTRILFRRLFRGIPLFDDVNRLYELDLDAVYITTPISSHFPVARTVYSEEIADNLFVEKTLASSYREAKKLCHLAHHSDGVNMVGYTRRFSVIYKKAKDLLTQDAIGDIISFKAYAYSSDFLGSEKDRRGPVGVLRDLGCHAVDLALWFFGNLKVDSVKSSNYDCSDDYTSFTVRHANGVKGEFDVSSSMPNYRMPEVGLLIRGSKGTMKANDDMLKLDLESGKPSLWYRHNLGDNVAFWLGGPEYFREDEYFADSVAAGNDATPSFDSASKVDQIIDNVSARGGISE